MAVFLNKYKNNKIGAYSWRYALASLFFAAGLISASPAFAGAEIDGIARNMVQSSDQLPALLSGLAYLLALLFTVTGVLKLKEHVSNPQQTPLRSALIRFLVGGALLALPIMYEAMMLTFNGGVNPDFDGNTTAIQFLATLLGSLAALVPLSNANAIMDSIIDSIEETPALVSAVAYLLALVFGISGLLKLKEHVENPEQVHLRESVVRLLAGGALFAIPIIYQGMMELVGAANIWGQIVSAFGAAGLIYSSYGFSICNPVGGLLGGIGGLLGLGNGATLGSSFCGLFFNAGAFPAFLTAISYLIGLILGVWGILKIKAHVLNPQQTSLWEGVSRLVAGGAFFSLPVVIEVARNTISPATTGILGAVAQRTTFNEAALACDGTSGLDGALYCMMNDLLTPVHVATNFFTTCAAFVFAMIGISRLMKTAQDGARGPGGLGTIMTFAAAGALLSYNSLVRAATVTLSLSAPGLSLTATRANMMYTKGLSAAEAQHVHTVISAIIKFMIIVGLISFVRGIFIVRSVAEGNSQASLMAGVTHMVGGALAVNLGPLINLVQNTLGVANYGIAFT